jgi:superfamily II DNA or RNA helicase
MILSEQTSSVEAKVLRLENAAGEYEVYKAAIEWDLMDPIVIESQADLKSASRWEGKITPFYHQVNNLMTFCRRLPVTLLADDVGLGKTISAGLIVSELAARGRVAKVLVVAPKLLGNQWKEELESKFGIPAQVAIGKELKTADPGEFGVVITTYNTARMYLDQLPVDRFQMLILDEAHKLRNLYGVEKPPQVAVKFQKALRDRRFRYVLMLTATPIQNRLWDLYSLVDLLAIARGHQNPFGSEGMFARKFIGDDRETARKLKPDAKDAFQAIVYGYMSRVRRGDAKLYFPDRIVRMEKIIPSQGELALIETIAKPIQSLSILVQISILQALASSPEALSSQLENMGRKGSVPLDLVATVKQIVATMPTAAKLRGLGALVQRLKNEDPTKWRLVIFTTRRETQTTIEAYLSEQGLKVGLINGSTGGRNSETIKGFWANPPQINVIVSTEAGSEGVNLQIANVLVNYDLPWNPMIVEQRIGRVQRLASQHANVSIFNITLKGTFEEYIVGRLMEKLQMASHAIGDIESLLEASGVDQDEEGSGFEETVRQLVVAALAGADVEQAARLREQSIDDAKEELERERKNIDALIGDMDGSAETGPRAPKLPQIERSMEPRRFVVSALRFLGGSVTEDMRGNVFVEQGGTRHQAVFDQADVEGRAVLYAPGSAAFSRLVSRIVSSGIHCVSDITVDPDDSVRHIVADWLKGFGGKPKKLGIASAERRFRGKALARIRASVQHDAYERVIEVACDPETHVFTGGRTALLPMKPLIEDVTEVGINKDAVRQAAEYDPAIMEFRRFYLERRTLEERSAGDDERKRHKLHEDFTPRVSVELVGLEGKVGRNATLSVTYAIDETHEYTDTLSLDLDSRQVVSGPTLQLCTSTGQTVPATCLAKCSFTGAEVLKHLLVRSDTSGRYAQREFAVICSVSGRNMLKDEVETSTITGATVARELLKTSAVSGARAEPSFVHKCEFTGDIALKTELATSALSGKLYRSDQGGISTLSGKKGHASEFVTCHETRRTIAKSEAEQCAVTGHWVRPGVLMTCSLSGKRALPSELQRCSVTGDLALREFLVASSVSSRPLLRSQAVASFGNDNFCMPNEAEVCTFSGRLCHPRDMVTCTATGLRVNANYLAPDGSGALSDIVRLLAGTLHSQDAAEKWPTIAAQASTILGNGRLRIEGAKYTADSSALACRCEVKTFLGMFTSQVAFVFSIREQAIVGRLVRKDDLPHLRRRA